MKNLILFAEQATEQSKSLTLGDIAVYGITFFAVSCIAYLIIGEFKEERDSKKRSYAIGQWLRYMDDVANKDYDALDSRYEKKDTKPKRK